MANFSTQRTLPDRTYGLVMPIGAMAEAATGVTIRKTKKDQRVELLTMVLSACNLGRENSGMMKMSLRLLSNDQLTLVEEAAIALRASQDDYNRIYGRQQSSFRGLHTLNHVSPYDHIVKAVVMGFQKTALIALRDFSRAHHSMGELTRLCTIMDQQGIKLTKHNVEVQIAALNQVTSGRRKQDVLDHPYLDYPELIRAVHEYPKHVHDLLDLLRTRGSVKAASEIFASSNAISEGAL